MKTPLPRAFLTEHYEVVSVKGGVDIGDYRGTAIHHVTVGADTADFWAMVDGAG